MCHGHGNTAWPCKMPFKIMGLMMIFMGLLWLGMRLGWLDLAWLRFIPFGPVMLIMFGIWMLYRGVISKKWTIKKQREV